MTNEELNTALYEKLFAEQILTIDKSRVIKYLGKVSDEQMKRIDEAIMVSLGLSK